MVNVITNRQSERAALAVAGTDMPDGTHHPDADFFEEQVLRYFPEFEGFEHVKDAYGEHYWFWLYVDESGRVHNDRESLSWVAVSHMRDAIYAAEYRHFTDAVIDDIWDALSLGADAPADASEKRITAKRLADIWDDRLAPLREADVRATWGWAGLLARYKTGKDEYIFDLAKAADIDVAVAAYLEGVALADVMVA